MFKKSFFVVLLVCSLMSAVEAEVFHWKLDNAVTGNYADPTNWDVGAVGAENPQNLVPGSGDEIFGAHGASWNFGGCTHTIGKWDSLKDLSGNNSWTSYTVDIANGVFNVLSRYSRRDVINVMDGAKLVFPAGSTYVASLDDGAVETITVKAHGRVEFLGNLWPYKLTLHTERYGTAIVDPESFHIHEKSAQENKITIYGTNVFPRGLVFDGSGLANSKLTMTLGWSGRLIAAGNFSRNGKSGEFNLSVAGGGSKIETIGDLSFSGIDSCQVKANTDFIVNEGNTLDISNFSFYDNLLDDLGREVVCVKSGEGTIAVGSDLPPKFRIDAGTVAVKMQRNDLAGLVFPNGNVCIRYDVTGCRLDATEYSEQISNLSFESGIDLSSLTAGAILFSSKNEDVRAAMKEELLKDIPDGLGIAESGDSLVLQKADVIKFNTSVSSDLSEPSAWTGGVVPDGGSVMITGSGSAICSSGSPTFSEIMVTEGATLVLQGGTESSPLVPPPLGMAYNGKIVCAAGSYVKLTNEIACTAVASALPVFEIATNAVLYADVPDHETKGLRFKNMKLNYFGTIKLPDGVNYSTPCITFGTASEGESALFGLNIDGGVLEVRDSITNWKSDGWYGNATMIRVMCPEEGGEVRPAGDFVWRNFVKTPEYRTEQIDGKNETIFSNSGYQMGVGNPEDIRFTIHVSGTPMWLNGTSVIGGGADIVCTGAGSGLVRSDALVIYTLTQHVTVTNAAKITLKDGAKFSYPYCCGGNKGSVYFTPTEKFHVALELEGGVSEMYKTASVGEMKAKAVVRNGCYDIGRLIPETVNKPETGWAGAAYGKVFERFAAIEIHGLLQVRATDAFPRPAWWNFEGYWDHEVDFTDMPVVGDGSILVTNITANNSMTLTMLNRGNQATGTIAAAPGTRSRLLFKDDANWMGTVVANGCVGLVNTDAATGKEKAAVVKFKNIHMDGEFPIRIWNTEAARTNDFIDIVGAITGNEGGFCGVPMDGHSPKAGEVYRIATYPASAALPASTVTRWRIDSVPHESDETKVVLTLTYQPIGTTIILR